jgi:diguanylate cyclase (GGDEF)-like protein
MLKKLINFITFVDLPIRKKFMLFSLGVLFWFVAMFVVSIATSMYINNKTGKIVNQVIPHDRITQKITRKLNSLSVDATEIMNDSDNKDLNQKSDLSRVRIMDIRSFISALTLGGQVHDINRDNNKVIESFTVAPVKGTAEAENYSNDLRSLIDTLNIKLAEIVDLKINILNNNLQDDGQLAGMVSEYKQLISKSISLSNDYSAEAAKLYAASSEKIRYITKFSLYILIGVLLIATTLLVIFTITISNSLATLIKSIIDQMRSLGTGKVDLTKKIAVKSKDEIGTLSEEFNNLTDEIHDLVTFKKVIEEDNSLEDVYSRLGNAFSDKSALDEFVIYEISDNSNKMKPVYPLILNDKELFCNEEILDNCTLCKVEKTGHTISSITYHGICKEFKSDIEKEHICVPMIIGGKTGGVVQFLFDKQDYSIDRKDKRLFKAEQYIKESLAVIETKRLTNTLRESALKDSLTGLYNRRFLQEYTETLIAGVLRREKNVGLIMCDLDYFKQVNDVYGHNVGDQILRETSNIIKNSVRAADLVIRFGGEEFLVLVLDINEGETLKLAEKIRETVEGTKIKIPAGTIKKTISLGVSEFPVDTESFWQAIKFADAALYKAKESGRNKAVRFKEEIQTEEQLVSQ